ncbi:MAG: hypothetical protein HC866_01255 [Leptolyngbyaceae cyanobacterium RU_5_1]|nr:hypothetical protein [Leptolyngbyaceae cyanobacterium RU_5_1]
MTTDAIAFNSQVSDSIHSAPPAGALITPKQPADCVDEDVFDWKRIDSLKFVIQVCLSVVILGLCIGKLTVGSQSDSDKALYWGGITGLIAWWMPSPSITRSATKSEK